MFTHIHLCIFNNNCRGKTLSFSPSADDLVQGLEN